MITKYTAQMDEFNKEKEKQLRKEKNLKGFLQLIKNYAIESIQVKLDDNLNVVNENESESNDSDLVNLDMSAFEKTLDSSAIETKLTQGDKESQPQSTLTQ
ncbi:unnamed protein product [Brachionus calyciflorus]|uniref:Uncharacterized protein n=1 Tax=Brachionus calyciflorus TaxID=104777 RepID=A0A813M9C6_9BILA|nr:unnamed protein product [Brachionus calyciflorus]